jgi:hypothetical protein
MVSRYSNKVEEPFIQKKLQINMKFMILFNTSKNVDPMWVHEIMWTHVQICLDVLTLANPYIYTISYADAF